MKRKHLQWISYSILAAGLSLSGLSAADDIETKEEAPESQTGELTVESIQEPLRFIEIPDAGEQQEPTIDDVRAAQRAFNQNVITAIKVLTQTGALMRLENPSDELHYLQVQFHWLFNEATTHLNQGTDTRDEFMALWDLALEMNALEVKEWTAEQEAQRDIEIPVIPETQEEAQTQLTQPLELRDNTGLSPCTLTTVAIAIAAALAGVATHTM